MHYILQEYKNLVEFLGNVMGPDYEIVLHELGKKNRVIAIANGHISSRGVGAPITSKALQMLKDEYYKEGNFELNYLGLSKNGNKLRSSTYFIKDELGVPIGLLCINFDDTRYKNISEQILQLCHPQSFIETNTNDNFAPAMLIATDETASAEQFPETVEEIINDTIKQISDHNSVPVERLTQEEKINIVDQLNRQRVFDIKGSVSCVAQALMTSEASIYRYLSKLKRME